MKIIDLLNKIANGEKIKKLKYQNHIYEYCNGDFKEDVGEYDSNWLFASEIIDLENLNDEVEIIEDDKEDDKIKKINSILRINDLKPPYDGNLEMIWKNIIIQQNKINEIIDKLNELEV